MKVKKVAIIIQNYIQYESFLPAIDILKLRKISIDVIIPDFDISEKKWTEMYNDIFENLHNSDLNIIREVDENKEYDILFATHEIEQYKNVKYKYFVKFRYAVNAKPWHSLSYKNNYMFDAILCYGDSDEEVHSNFAKTFKIGNLKYAYFNKKIKPKRNKFNLLYLPTYGDDNSVEEVLPKLLELKKEYNVMIKLHHGTNFLSDEKEIKTKQFVEDNFETIFSSSDSLLKILNDVDVVISDNSGAIWDAVATLTPLVIFKKNNDRQYYDFKPLQQKIVEDGFVCATGDVKQIPMMLKKALSIKYQKKEKLLFKKIFYCDNGETINKFDEFINAIENDFLTDEYIQIHNNKKREIRELVDRNHFLEINNEILEERLSLLYERLEKSDLEKEKLLTELGKEDDDND